MGTTSQSEHVLSEFFITASKVSEVAARGLQDALKDAPKCHFQILQKLQCIVSKNGDTREVAVSDFVRYTGLSPQAVSRLLRVLEKEGLIERKADINDHRKTLISITDDGETKRRVCQSMSADYLYEVIGEFGIENLKKLNELNTMLLIAFENVENRKYQSGK